MVHYCRRSKPSALALQEKLIEAGYSGPHINFGHGMCPEGLNSPQAIHNATNKKLMRELFNEHGVPAPLLYKVLGDNPVEDFYVPTPQMFPMVGRPDIHRQGRGFWKCRTIDDIRRAVRGTRRKAAATHFMEYIDIDREFRVHIVNGKSIKISQKDCNGTPVDCTMNHRNGVTFSYPHDFHHKKTLRRVARQAVEALGLDFGAVDIMWSEGKPYVSEVNSAPCLTDRTSDTLYRYVNAFRESYANVGIHN